MPDAAAPLPTLVAIEIADVGLQVVDERGLVGEDSPGCALADGERVLTGRAALRQARSSPRLVEDRVWSRLDDQPIGRPFPRGLSRADLAHAQLSEIWAAAGHGVDGVLLAVPGSLTEAQLGLLLGIARAAAIPVTGLVDAALAGAAASAAGGPARRWLHVDLELHRAVVTELEREGSTLARSRVLVSEQTGLAGVMDRLARRLAEIFVRQTRFDPLHAADSEQALHDRLGGWLRTLEQADSVTCRLPATDDEDRTIELARTDLLSSVEGDYRHLETLVGRFPGGVPTSILLTHRATRLPGLVAKLGRSGSLATGPTSMQVVVLAAAAAGSGALAHRHQIESPGETVPFITRLELADGDEPAEARGESPEPDGRSVVDGRGLSSGDPEPGHAGQLPTHLLYRGVAHRVTAEPLVLGLAPPAGARGLPLAGVPAGVSRRHCCLVRQGDRVVVEDLSRYGTFVNGQRVEGVVELRTGDRLWLGSSGIELQLIRVVD